MSSWLLVVQGAIVARLSVLGQAPKPERIVKLVQEVELFSLTKLFVAAVIIALGFAASRLVQEALDRLGEGNARRRLLMKKSRVSLGSESSR